MAEMHVNVLARRSCRYGSLQETLGTLRFASSVKKVHHPTSLFFGGDEGVCGVATSRWVVGELLHRCFKSPSSLKAGAKNLQQAPNALTEGYTVPPSGSDRCARMPSPTSRTGGVSSDFWRASLQRLGRARPRHGRRLLPKAPGMILSSVLRHRPWFPRVCVSDGRGGSWQPRAASFSESEGICSLQSFDMKRWPAQR